MHDLRDAVLIHVPDRTDAVRLVGGKHLAGRHQHRPAGELATGAAVDEQGALGVLKRLEKGQLDQDLWHHLPGHVNALHLRPRWSPGSPPGGLLPRARR